MKKNEFLSCITSRSRLVVVFLLVSISTCFSQNKEALANQYYVNSEYEKAAEAYTKLYKRDAREKYYAAALKSYIKITKYAKAEKLIKKHSKIASSPLLCKIDLAQLYKEMGKARLAQSTIRELISEMPALTQVILEVGKKLYQVKDYSNSIEAYKKGRKRVKGDYPFSFELAEVYAAAGATEKMVGEILFVLTYGDSYLEAVKSAMETHLYGDVNGKKRGVFKRELIKLVQDNPEKDSFLELLIWMEITAKKYRSAFLFSKSLDKRNDENGRRIMNLATVSRRNFEFDVARDCYKYVIESNENKGYHYRNARLQLVSVIKQKLENQASISPEDINDLAQNYASTLEEIKISEYSIRIVREYAEVLAFYQGKTEEATKLLEKGISFPRVSEKEKALCMLLLGDIYVLTDEVWEASLVYGKVNTKFKNDPVGYSAKLKSAKAFYYTGNFEWAKTQLDVLKAATSKLIANDALQLSVLISENLGMDTSVVPLQMYAKADLWNFQKNTENALAQLNEILDSFPDHPSLLDDVHYLKASIYLKQEKWENAVSELETVVTFNDLLTDDAILKLGKIHEEVLHDNVKAQAYYEMILLEHTGSVHVVEARKKYRKLRGS